MSTASAEFPRVRRVRRRLAVRFMAQVALFLLACMIGESVMDAIQLRKVRAAMFNPADKDGWAASESWFIEYTEAVPWRHVFHRRFILSDEAAAAELLTARIQRDRNAWASVEKCIDDASRYILALEYLEKFPQGEHRSDTLQIQTEWEMAKARDQLRASLMELTSRLQSIAEEVKQAEKSTHPDFKQVSEKLDRLARDARSLSGLDVADESLLKQWQNIVAGVGAKNAEIAARVAAGVSRKEFYDYVKRGEWEGAGKLLIELRGEEFADLREHFEHNAIPQVEAKAIRDLGNGSNWNPVLASVRKFDSPEMRRLFSNDSNIRRTRLEGKIRERGDRFLYEQCRNVQSAKTFEDYDKDAPLGTMRETAQTWIHYFSLCENRNRYRITVSSIDWSDKANDADLGWDKENLMEITIGEVTKKTSFGSQRNGTVVLADKERFAVTVSDILAREQQNITVKLWDVDRPDGNDSFGREVFRWSLEGLQGLKRSLSEGSEYGTNYVTFQVEVWDNEKWVKFKKPAIPSWKPLD